MAIEVTNKRRGPTQLIVRSHLHPSSFTTKCIAGIGSGSNVVILRDEQIVPEYLERAKNNGYITTKYVNTEQEGE